MKVLTIVCVLAALAVTVLATTADAELDLDLEKPRKNKAKAKKWFKPKMVRRGTRHHHGVRIVPKGDPRAYAPVPDVWVGDAVLPLPLREDTDLLDGAAADLESTHYNVAHGDHVDHVDVITATTPLDVAAPADVAALAPLDPVVGAAGALPRIALPTSVPTAPAVPQVPAVPTAVPAVPFPAMGTNAAKADAVVPPAARPVLRNTPGAGCTAIKGTCSKAASCTGTVQRGLCPGDATVACCVPKATAPATTPTTPTTPVASGLPMCSNNGASSGAFDGASPLLNVKNKATRWSLAPAVAYTSEAGNPYRVPRDAYGDLPITDARLVTVASTNGVQRLHRVCAARFNALAAAAKAAGVGTLAVASGWRVHPYKNDYNYYCQQMKKSYPTKTCAEAGAVKAFKSPHETGLAFDLGSPKPFAPSMAAKNAQLASAGFRWLRDNAHRFGVTPYKHEPWHWECVIPREAWVKGCEFVANGNYNTRIRETRVADGAAVNDISAWKA